MIAYGKIIYFSALHHAKGCSLIAVKKVTAKGIQERLESKRHVAPKKKVASARLAQLARLARTIGFISKRSDNGDTL